MTAPKLTEAALLKQIQEELRLLRRDIIKSNMLKDAVKSVVSENKRLEAERKELLKLLRDMKRNVEWTKGSPALNILNEVIAKIAA